MPQHLKQANMRLLRISAMLSWRALPVYEDVQQGDYLQLPYASVPSSTWARCLTLSWRWGKPKPAAYVPDYSPATNEQWSELQDLLRHACANGLEYVWIDWCCMPQYQSDAIPEVMRSKVGATCWGWRGRRLGSRTVATHGRCLHRWQQIYT